MTHSGVYLRSTLEWVWRDGSADKSVLAVLPEDLSLVPKTKSRDSELPVTPALGSHFRGFGNGWLAPLPWVCGEAEHEARDALESTARQQRDGKHLGIRDTSTFLVSLPNGPFSSEVIGGLIH